MSAGKIMVALLTESMVGGEVFGAPPKLINAWSRIRLLRPVLPGGKTLAEKPDGKTLPLTTPSTLSRGTRICPWYLDLFSNVLPGDRSGAADVGFTPPLIYNI